MKPKFSSPWARRAQLAAISAIFTLGAAYAADFTWDSDTATAGPQDGLGTWDNANINWISGGANVAYPAPPATTVVPLATPATTAAQIGLQNTLTFASVAGLVVGQESSFPGFPIGTTITAIDPVTKIVTFSQNISAAATAGNYNYAAPANNATFGSAGGAAGLITVASAQSARNLTLNAATSGNYTFTGPGILTLGSVREFTGLTVNSSATFNNQVNILSSGSARIAFNTANQSLNFTGGGSILGAAGNNSGISGSSNTIRESSTINVTAGTYNAGAAIWNIGDQTNKTGGVRISGASTNVSVASLQLGREGGKGSYATVNSGATMTLVGQGSIGRSGGNFGTLTIDNAKLVNNYANNAETSIFVGREGGNGKVEIINNGRLEVGAGLSNNQGGVVAINSQSSTAGSVGTLDIISGIAVIKDIRLNGNNQYVAQGASVSTQGTAILNLGAGGALYLGGAVSDTSTPGATGGTLVNTAGGLSNRGISSSAYQVNLNGGILGASAAWVSSVVMTLGSGTNTTIKAASETGVANNITFTGQLTGGGGITKTEGGILTLNSTTFLNNFSGGTTINAGTVVASATGSFGTGNVNLGAATLTLNTLATIADTAGLYFGTGSVVKLDYTGTEIVSAISNGTKSLAPGTYTVANLTTEFGAGIFSSSTGLGTLTIIPEPSSAALLGLAAGTLAFSRRRRVA